MAPKAVRTMKRPAAQVTSMRCTSEALPKKQKLSCGEAEHGPNSILHELSGEVPSSVIQGLAAIMAKRQQQPDGLRLGGAPWQDCEKSAVATASKALCNIEARLGAEVHQAQTKLDIAGGERSAHVIAMEDAESEVAKAKHAIADAKFGIKASSKSIELAREEVQRAKVAQKSAVGDVKSVVAKVEQLESANKDAFQPLKQTSAKGASGKMKLQRLRRTGKQLEFHDVMLNATMPKVLMKSLSKRQTFDRFVLDQVEAEFSKKRAQFESSLQQQESAKRDCDIAIQTAQENRVESQQAHAAETSNLAKAEERNGWL